MKRLLIFIAALVLAINSYGQDAAKTAVEKQINDSISANGLRQITGPRLNTVMHAIDLLGMDTTQVLRTIAGQIGATIPGLVGGGVPFSELPKYVDTIYLTGDSLYFSIKQALSAGHVTYGILLPSGSGSPTDSSGGWHTQPYNDVRYVKRTDSTVLTGYASLGNLGKIRDSLGLVIAGMNTHDSTSANALQTKYRSDSARANVYGQLAGKQAALSNGGSAYRIYLPNGTIKTLSCSGCTIDSTTIPGTLIITITGGGSGNTNSNVGTGYRLAFPNTNNIRTIFCTNCSIDSTTNANALTFKFDTVGTFVTLTALKDSLAIATAITVKRGLHPVGNATFVLGDIAGVPWDSTIYLNASNATDLVIDSVLGHLKINFTGDVTGDMFYRNSSGYLQRLTPGTSGFAIISNGPGTAPSYQAVAGGGGSSPPFNDGSGNPLMQNTATTSKKLAFDLTNLTGTNTDSAPPASQMLLGDLSNFRIQGQFTFDLPPTPTVAHGNFGTGTLPWGTVHGDNFVAPGAASVGSGGGLGVNLSPNGATKASISAAGAWNWVAYNSPTAVIVTTPTFMVVGDASGNLGTQAISSGSTLTRVLINTGTTYTIPGSNYNLILNFSAPISSFTITTAAATSMTDGQIIRIHCYGGLGNATTMISSLTITGGTGVHITEVSPAFSLREGEFLEFRWDAGLGVLFHDN